MMQNASLLIGGQPLRSHLHEGHVRTDDPAHYHKCIRRMYDSMMTRKLATTGKGHLAAVTPHACVGDLIAIVPGCGWPLLLRQDINLKQAGYRIVSHCHVQGLMNGEIVGALDEGKVQFEEIRLI